MTAHMWSPDNPCPCGRSDCPATPADVTERLSDVEREALTCDCAESVMDADQCPFHSDNGDLWVDLPADALVRVVESILAARLAEAEQAAEQRGAERV